MAACPKSFFVCLLVLSAPLCAPSLAQTVSPEKLENLIAEAEKNNPRIQQAFHQWKAAEHKIKEEEGLPDPRVSYAYFGRSVETRVGPQEQKFGVSQKVPFPGKLKDKGEIQETKARILKEKYEAVKTETARDVKLAFYDLYWMDRDLEISAEEKSILEDAERVAQKKYETNLSPQNDVIKLQVELSKIIEKTTLIKQNRARLEARMNALLGRPAETPLSISRDLDRKEVSYPLSEAIEKASKERQELIAADLNVKKSELAQSLARKESLPDVTFGFEYISIGGGTTSSPDDGRDAWAGTVAIDLPFWWDRINSGIRASEEELAAAQEKQKDVRDRVEYEVQDEYFKIAAYKDIVALYESALVPQARQAFESSQKGFETGSVSFIDWLDAQRTYLQTRLAYYKAVADYQKAVASLERVVGE